MKKLPLMMALVAALLWISAPGFVSAAEKACTLKVEGMTCSKCEDHVKKALGKVEGYKSAEVDVKGKTVRVKYESEKTSPDALAKAVTEEGYEAKVEPES